MTQLAARTSVNSCYWCLTFSNVLSPLTAHLNMRLRILSILLLFIKMCLCYSTEQFVPVFTFFFSEPFHDYKIVLKKNVVIEISQLENNSIHTVMHWVWGASFYCELLLSSWMNPLVYSQILFPLQHNRTMYENMKLLYYIW